MKIKRLLVLAALTGVLIMGGFAYFVYVNLFVPNTAFLNEEAHVYIKSDDNFHEVLANLEPLLKKPQRFARVATQKKYATNIKPGHYILTPGMNNNTIINVLRAQNTPVKVTFRSYEQLPKLAGQISKQIEADSLALLNAMQDSIWLNAKAFKPEEALGMFLPNTYEFYWNTSAEAFCERMWKEYTLFWNDTRKAKAKSINLNPKEISVLASIVQRESRKTDEQARVAGVYLNRLKRGMPLQADPTVIFAKKLQDNDFEQIIRRVLYADLKIDSPFNTYKYKGLPPAPICIPELSVIDKVLNAEAHHFLYFVADINKPGYHSFSRTLREHNAKSAAYRRWINSQQIYR